MIYCFICSGDQELQWNQETLLNWPLQNKSPDLEALEHVQVLLAELEVLGQQAERLHVVELPGSEEAQDELVVSPQEADVRPRHDHIPHLQNREPQIRGTSVQRARKTEQLFPLKVTKRSTKCLIWETNVSALWSEIFWIRFVFCVFRVTGRPLQ